MGGTRAAICRDGVRAYAAPCGSGQAAIAVDSISSASHHTNVLTWSHTVGSGSNRVSVVGVSKRDGNRTVNSVTYGGWLSLALSQVGRKPESRGDLVADRTLARHVVIPAAVTWPRAAT